MKTTFKQYLQEATMPKAESENDLFSSIKDGKFTKDGSHLINDGDIFYYNTNLTSLVGVPSTCRGDFNCSYNKLTSLEGGPVTVIGSFHCYESTLTSLEGAPLVVNNDFFCNKNHLSSLVGGPKSVGKNFSCHHNKLKSLDGSPSAVGGYFDCANNKLTSLEWAPRIIGDDFDCSNNKLSSLKDIHKHITEIRGGYLYADGNPIKSHVLGLLKIKSLKKIQISSKKVEDIINKYLPEGDIFACQQELIDAGLEEYAQL